MKAVKKRLDSAQVQEMLRQYEEKYGMASDTFYELFTRGRMDDRRDFFLWAGFYNMRAATVSSHSFPFHCQHMLAL